ncbi:hypothetical protein O9992_22205 [Vibrio lentus]|nr:hypothetical protein [Vibrio lentus]
MVQERRFTTYTKSFCNDGGVRQTGTSSFQTYLMALKLACRKVRTLYVARCHVPLRYMVELKSEFWQLSNVLLMGG